MALGRICLATEPANFESESWSKESTQLFQHRPGILDTRILNLHVIIHAYEIQAVYMKLTGWLLWFCMPKQHNAITVYDKSTLFVKQALKPTRTHKPENYSAFDTKSSLCRKRKKQILKVPSSVVETQGKPSFIIMNHHSPIIHQHQPWSLTSWFNAL